MKSSTPEAYGAEVVFKNQSPLFVVLTLHISMPHSPRHRFSESLFPSEERGKESMLSFVYFNSDCRLVVLDLTLSMCFII